MNTRRTPRSEKPGYSVLHTRTLGGLRHRGLSSRMDAVVERDDCLREPLEFAVPRAFGSHLHPGSPPCLLSGLYAQDTDVDLIFDQLCCGDALGRRCPVPKCGQQGQWGTHECKGYLRLTSGQHGRQPGGDQGLSPGHAGP
jgi:hypothetical protein